MVPKWSVFFKDKWWTRLGSGSITSVSEVWERKRFQFACCCLISQWQKVESVPNNGVRLLTLRIPCREWVESFSGSGSTLVKQLLLTSFNLKTSTAFSVVGDVLSQSGISALYPETHSTLWPRHSQLYFRYVRQIFLSLFCLGVDSPDDSPCYKLLQAWLVCNVACIVYVAVEQGGGWTSTALH